MRHTRPPLRPDTTFLLIVVGVVIAFVLSEHVRSEEAMLALTAVTAV